MKKILPAVFLIVGSIIGAGFASGREISLFFAEFGFNSLYFLPIVFILFYYLFKMFLSLGSKQKFENVFSINYLSNSSVFFNLAVVAIFIIYAAAMFAGSVEVLSHTFINIPNIIFAGIVFALCYLILTFGFKGLVKVNFILTPIIVVLLLVYAVYSIAIPITNIPFVPSSTGAHILPVSIVIYVFGNIMLSYFILTEAGYGLTEKEIQKTSFYASLIICLALLICIVCLITNGTVIMDASMPFVVLTLRLGEPFPLIFTTILFLGIITSLFSCLHTINMPFQKKYGKKSIILTCLIVFIISLFGFQTIVNYCYPVVGLFGVLVVGKILIWERNKSKQNT